MANAWGNSWGSPSAWGNSWGTTTGGGGGGGAATALAGVYLPEPRPRKPRPKAIKRFVFGARLYAGPAACAGRLDFRETPDVALAEFEELVASGILEI